MIIERELKEKINWSIKNSPITAIVGARQVGKTTLAKEILKGIKNTKYIDLEKPSDFEALNDEEQYFNLNRNIELFCVDEIQLKPNIYNTLRNFVDENKNIRFLILGSASPELLRQSSESLAGRIFYYTLNPFMYDEIKNIKSLNKYHLLGGFPKSVLSNNKTAFVWLQNFIKTFLERDLQLFGYNIPPLVLRRLWIMLAHINGQLLNYSYLAKSMGLDAKTIRKYVDILHHTYMIRLHYPYHSNIKKRMIKAPKIYISDTGILHSLLGINSYESLYTNPIFGTSWETLVIENIISKFNDWENYFYRTSDGVEIDLILKKGNKIIAIEIKSNLKPKLYRGFWAAIDDLKVTKAYIIAPVNQIYPYKNGVLVYNLEAFLKLDL